MGRQLASLLQSEPHPDEEHRYQTSMLTISLQRRAKRSLWQRQEHLEQQEDHILIVSDLDRMPQHAPPLHIPHIGPFFGEAQQMLHDVGLAVSGR